MAQDQELPEIKLDADNLYREEIYTDRRAGTLRKLVPVTAEGAEDTSRETIFEGSASLMTPGGALPLNFELDAASVSDALDKFPDTARQALEETLDELQRMRRESSSSIITPGQGGGGGMGGPGGMGGGMGGPGGGIIGGQQ